MDADIPSLLTQMQSHLAKLNEELLQLKANHHDLLRQRQQALVPVSKHMQTVVKASTSS